MANLNRMCKVCGNKYSYCPSCSADANKPKWMKMFDCEDCKTIFDTLTKFNLGKIDKLEAKNILLGTNTNKNFTESIKHEIDDIMTEPKEEPVIIQDPTVEIDFQKKNKKYKRPQFDSQEI